MRSLALLALAALSLPADEEAARDFRAMQFTIVVETNERAVNLWKSLGFRILGTIPEAFHHRTLGYVGAHIMFREL